MISNVIITAQTEITKEWKTDLGPMIGDWQKVVHNVLHLILKINTSA